MAGAAWNSLESGAVVLTAGARLAAALTGEFERRQRAAGKRAWATAEIYPLEVWLERCWRAAGERVLLEGAQERLLWDEAIRGGLVGDAAKLLDVDLLDVRGTAEEAAAAWRLVQAWKLPLPARSLDHGGGAGGGGHRGGRDGPGPGAGAGVARRVSRMDAAAGGLDRSAAGGRGAGGGVAGAGACGGPAGVFRARFSA